MLLLQVRRLALIHCGDPVQVSRNLSAAVSRADSQTRENRNARAPSCDACYDVIIFRTGERPRRIGSRSGKLDGGLFRRYPAHQLAGQCGHIERIYENQKAGEIRPVLGLRRRLDHR